MTVEIRVSTRPGWYQVSEDAVDSSALAGRVAHLAMGEWSRLGGRVDVEVVGFERGGEREAWVRIPARHPVAVAIRPRSSEPAG